MKTIAVLLVVCIVSALGAHVELTEEQKAKFKANKDACLAETGVDPAVATKGYKEGQWDENDPKLRCFTACMLKKKGVIDENGVVDEAATRAAISAFHPPEKVEEVLTKCKDLKGVDTCDTAFQVTKCYSALKHSA